MTATYDKLGLKFLYPENWKLIDDTDSDFPHVVTLETPDGGATWTVHVYPEDANQDDVLKETLATLTETYEDAEVSKIEKPIGDTDCTGVEVLFYCLDFLVRAEIKFVKTSKYLLMVWTQAEDRDFDKQELVFSAISIGLIRSLDGEA